MNIYIASSFRNRHAVELLQDRLRGQGHTILDWLRLAPPLPAGLRPDERRAALDADERQEIFRFCAAACARVDMVIYLGPSGQDAACEVGMAYAAGVPVAALYSPLEAPGAMLAGCVTYECSDYTALDAAIREVEEL